MKKTIEKCLGADIPILLWGAPGTGKTAYIKSLVEKNGATLETLIGATLDPTDVVGFPVVVGDRAVFAPPAWAICLRDAVAAGRPAYLFLDEFSCAPPAVQAPLLRVVNERFCGEVSLAGVKIIAAANHSDYAADGGSLAGATSNRWAHVEWIPDLSTWEQGEVSGWGKSRPRIFGEAAAKIAAYLRKSPKNFLLPPDPSSEKISGAWPSPRSWSMAVRLLAISREEETEEILTATVGPDCAHEGAEYFSSLDLPAAEELLAGKPLPQRGDRAACALSCLVAHVLASKNREELAVQAWKILGLARPDLVLVAARTLLAALPNVAAPEAVSLGQKIIGVKK